MIIAFYLIILTVGAVGMVVFTYKLGRQHEGTARELRSHHRSDLIPEDNFNWAIFWQDRAVEANAKADKLEREIAAMKEWAIKHGVEISVNG